MVYLKELHLDFLLVLELVVVMVIQLEQLKVHLMVHEMVLYLVLH